MAMTPWWGERTTLPVSGSGLHRPDADKKAPILIFDDSLSAVDTETDVYPRRRDVPENTATFISYRITTLCEADTILVLEKGRLVQQGTHQNSWREGLSWDCGDLNA